MLPEESPFPRGWWGISLDRAGLGDLRPNVGTYGLYEFGGLPPLQFDMRGDFAWLVSSPAHEQSIADERSTENAAALPLLCQSAARLGVQLPAAFNTFAETLELQRRVRSNTDCFFDVCVELVPSPLGGGYLIRFLADSQGCIFWYMHVRPGGSDHAIVSSPGFYGTDAEQWQEEPPDPNDIVYCAESFEGFICRFWLENEVWFAGWQGTPLPEVGRDYIERYRVVGSA